MQKIYLFDSPLSVSQHDYDTLLLPLLPPWRQQQAQQFRHLVHRVLCAKAFLLLQEGLRTDYGISGNLAFDYLPHGKPFLRHFPNIHFNLSHCLNGVLCVIDDINEVGCDIESVSHQFSDDLLRYCCCPSEINIIRRDPNPDLAFIRLWTAKEALAKLSGIGLDHNLPNILSHVEGVSLSTVVGPSSLFCYSVASRLPQ